jgi:hypothetical protein
MDFFKNTEDNEESSLLQTIRVPKNLLFLTDKLPQPNYEKIPPNKRNLSFTNNKSELPDIHGKNIQRAKKAKRPEKKEIPKENNKKEYPEKREIKDRISVKHNDATGEEILVKKNEKIDEDQEEIKKKRLAASLDQSHLSGGVKRENSPANQHHHHIHHHNIKILKSSDLDNNSSLVREKSPINEEKRKLKEANMMLPSIKGQGSVEYIKYEDNRSARNK